MAIGVWDKMFGLAFKNGNYSSIKLLFIAKEKTQVCVSLEDGIWMDNPSGSEISFESIRFCSKARVGHPQH
jgi:hypothetical protein